MTKRSRRASRPARPDSAASGRATGDLAPGDSVQVIHAKLHTKTPAERARLLEEFQAAQEANSEAAGVAYRLAVKIGRYQFILAELDTHQRRA